MKISLIEKNKQYIVAVSGGPDSMFLLDNVRKYAGASNIFVCTVNYQKRDDSYKDIEIVKSYCEKYNINYCVFNVGDKVYEEYKTISHNFQDIARKIRYDFFLEQAYLNNCEAVLIAHNLTDHIETYLLQKKRHNIVEYYGLAEQSIYHSKNNKHLKVLRPMLEVNRETIIKYLNDNKIAYALDYTNEMDIYQRNQIRKTISMSMINEILNEIDEKNKQLQEYKQQAKQYLASNNNSINLTSYKKIKCSTTRQIILFNLFKMNNFENLIVNKKKNFLSELDKQLCSNKPNIITEINSNYVFLKSYNICEIIHRRELETWNVEINKTNKSYEILDTQIMIVRENTINNKNIVCKLEELPIYVTNDQNIYSKLRMNNKKFNRILINNKINLLERIKNFVIYDKNYNIIYLSENWSLSIRKCLNDLPNMSSDNHFTKTLYFMIK